MALRGLSRLVTDHLEAGDFPEADRVRAERDELARSLELERFGWMEPLFASMRAMADGRFDACHASIAEATRRTGRARVAERNACCGSRRACMRLQVLKAS